MLVPDYQFTILPQPDVSCVSFDRRDPGKNPAYCELVEMMLQGEYYRDMTVSHQSGVCLEAVRMFNKVYHPKNASGSVTNACAITLRKYA